MTGIARSNKKNNIKKRRYCKLKLKKSIALNSGGFQQQGRTVYLHEWFGRFWNINTLHKQY